MIHTELKKLSIEEAVLYFALLIYPALTLTVRGGVNAAFAVIALISIFMIALSRIPLREIAAEQAPKVFALAMLSGAFAILVNQIYYQQFDPRPFDSELRFILAIFVFIALRNTPIHLVSIVEHAFPLGVLATLAFAQLGLSSAGRIEIAFLDAIHVGEITMILGFLSLVSINWLRKDRPYLLALKLSGFAVGMYLTVLTGSRGVWVAIPMLLLLWFAMLKKRPVSIKSALALIVLACLLSYSLLGIVKQRVDLAFSNLAVYSSGQVNNGTAARIELWKVSFLLFKENPILGIKQGSLDAELTKLRDTGVINDLVLEEGISEMHSDIAARMAKYGALGMLSLFLVYFVPMWMFYRQARSGNRVVNGAGKMGICLTLGFFVFGLTVETFNIKMVAAFYSLTVAVLLAIAYPVREVSGVMHGTPETHRA